MSDSGFNQDKVMHNASIVDENVGKRMGGKSE